MSLTILDDDNSQETAILSEEEKEAIEKVNKAKEEGEQIGAEAAKRMIE